MGVRRDVANPRSFFAAQLGACYNGVTVCRTLLKNAKCTKESKVERTPVSYTHLRANETVLDLVCRLLLEKKTLMKLHTHIRKLINCDDILRKTTKRVLDTIVRRSMSLRQ